MNILMMMITILLNLLILNYVYNLEKNNCECSKDWRRDFIKYFTIASVIIVLLHFLIKKLPRAIVVPFSVLYSILGLVNIYALFTYSRNMINDSCQCSNSWERNFIYYYSMIIIILYIIFILGLVSLMLFKPASLAKLRNKNRK